MKEVLEIKRTACLIQNWADTVKSLMSNIIQIAEDIQESKIGKEAGTKVLKTVLKETKRFIDFQLEELDKVDKLN